MYTKAYVEVVVLLLLYAWCTDPSGHVYGVRAHKLRKETERAALQQFRVQLFWMHVAGCAKQRVRHRSLRVK